MRSYNKYTSVVVDLTKVNKRTGIFHPRESGKVIGGNWDLDVLDYEKVWDYQCCYEHFVLGKEWSETLVYKIILDNIAINGEKDGCKNINDVINRYEKLDRIFEDVKTNGYLKSPSQVNPEKKSEKDGIMIHFGRNGEPIFGSQGCHRFAIAKILGLKETTCMLGVVHEDCPEEAFAL